MFSWFCLFCLITAFGLPMNTKHSPFLHFFDLFLPHFPSWSFLISPFSDFPLDHLLPISFFLPVNPHPSTINGYLCCCTVSFYVALPPLRGSPFPNQISTYFLTPFDFLNKTLYRLLAFLGIQIIILSCTINFSSLIFLLGRNWLIFLILGVRKSLFWIVFFNLLAYF